jgi:hypothetical protein
MAGPFVLEVAVEGPVALIQRNGQPLEANAVPSASVGVQSLTVEPPLVNVGTASDPIIEAPNATTGAAGWMNAADKTKLGAALVSPLTAPLDAGDQAVGDMKTATFDAVLDNGSSGAAKNLNWSAAQLQKLTLTAACTLTFTAPPGPGTMRLELVQGLGGGFTATWPASVKWPGGTAPTLSTGAGALDLVSLFWDGTQYLASAGLGFA